MKIASIFGAYSENLQSVVDNSLSRFAPTWYEKYFSFAPTQQTLTFTSVVGASRIEAAASVVDRSSSAPLRSRDKLSKYQGEIPAIKEKFSMSEEDYRDFLALQALSLDDETKKQQILDFLFGDVKKAGNSGHKRLDIMALEAVSTGKISLTLENNPDGLVLTNPLDLLMPSENKSSVDSGKKWSDIAKSTPITDITNVVTTASNKGRRFEKILMSASTWMKFRQSKEVIDSLVSFNQLQKGASVATLDKVNEYLQANQLPYIELINEVIGIEKDGKIDALRPFEDKNISFIPSGNLGVIKNAVSIEQLRPVENVNYAIYKKALISKWQDNDPWGEFTSVELNAFPALEAIDNIFILTVL